MVHGHVLSRVQRMGNEGHAIVRAKRYCKIRAMVVAPQQPRSDRTLGSDFCPRRCCDPTRDQSFRGPTPEMLRKVSKFRPKFRTKCSESVSNSPPASPGSCNYASLEKKKNSSFLALLHNPSKFSFWEFPKKAILLLQSKEFFIVFDRLT